MEWIVTTASSVEDAKERALDELGVDESEAEFEILETPTAGLFGRVRGEARVRARVVPLTPRPKVDRRDRRSSSTRSAGRGRKKPSAKAAAPSSERPPRRTSSSKRQPAADGDPAPTAQPAAPATPPAAASPAPAPAPDPSIVSAAAETTDKGATVSDITLSEQAETTAAFLRGLLDAFDFDGEVEIRPIDDDNTEVVVDGNDLGLLIGPRGQTLQAIGELSRAASAQALAGRAEGRVHIDIAHYREKRRAALAEFTEKVAAEVISSGIAKALEPMSAADRKVVHDTCNEIDGVTTLSEGEDPRRRVVIEPAN